MLFIPLLLVWVSTVSAQKPSQTLHQAIFSKGQVFWPELQQSARQKTVHIGVLPVQMAEYKETLVCDSCHRLSANGMEFFLENYLAGLMRSRFPKAEVELVAPHASLLQGGRINLLSQLDSLDFPWDKWFDGYSQDLIYRPRDRMTSARIRRRLDRLGGTLGATHLLIPARFRALVSPQRSDGHKGGIEWGFNLVFWNVVEGRPEWALAFSEKLADTDLDAPLEPHLDKALQPAWERLPEDLQALLQAEPR